MPSLRFHSAMVLAASGIISSHINAMKILCPKTAARPLSSRQPVIQSHTTLHASNNNRWWDKDSMSNMFGSKPSNEDTQEGSYEQQYKKYQQNNGVSGSQSPSSLITREMEEDVMASARATVDTNTVSRAVFSLLDDKSNGNLNKSGVQNYNGLEKKSSNSLRDLALSTSKNGRIQSNREESNSSQNSGNSWSTQQIAIASGGTTFLLSPLVIPIIHSLLPPIIPFPSSLSFSGAALLGTLSYIVALGDPTDQSNIITGKTGGVLGEGVEVGGAVSRIVGRTALQSVQTSAPRLKAAARAMVDYDTTTATLEELQRAQQQLSQTVLELELENDTLRKEMALWQAVEDVSSMYKLDELKEMARYEGLKGYSTDGKNALLRRLIREGILKLDLSPYY